MTDFLWPPNWASPVVERIEWLTDVQQSSNGTEVRQSLREKPRTSISYEVLVWGAEAVKLKNFIRSNQGKIVGMPWWIGGFQWTRTQFATLNVHTALGIDSTYQLGFGPLGSRVLVAKNGQQWVRPVTTASLANGRNLGLARADWPIPDPERPGCVLYPMVDCYMSSTQQLDMPTAGVVRFQVNFDVVNPIEYGEQTPATQHNSIPVFTEEPNRREDVSLEYQRLVQELDFGTGKRSYTDRSWQSFRAVTHEYVYQGISDIVGFKAFLNRLKGRRDELYLPSFECDFPNYQFVFPSRQSMQIDYEDVGYRFLYPRPEDVWIPSNTIDEIKPIASITTVAGRERITTEGLTITFEGIVRQAPQILHRSRLNTDSIEITWHTPELATVTLPFRTIRRD